MFFDNSITSLGWFALAIFICVWVYMDAKKRNLKYPLAWPIICFLLGVIGLAGYYIWVIRPDKHDS